MEIDKRILNLSYSSLLTLHSCPRKFQLYRLNAHAEVLEDIPQSITFAYGHVVGKGIQDILEGKSLERVIWEAFLFWDVDLFAENAKQNKSFWGAIHAIRQFHSMRESGYLDGYELVHYEGKPATELSFAIYLPDGFIYRGFVDVVLQHRDTGKVLCLECKTNSGGVINPAQYKNSAQAIGYSIVLDAIFPELSAYEVLYLVYQTKQSEFMQIPFEKSYFARALWIRELLLDIETIKMYEQAEIYPMRGESCYNYFRECEYLQFCTLSTERLISPITELDVVRMDEELAKFQIKVTLDDLIRAQLSKNVKAPVQDVPHRMITDTEDELL